MITGPRLVSDDLIRAHVTAARKRQKRHDAMLWWLTAVVVLAAIAKLVWS